MDNNTIRKETAAGVVTTLAGLAGNPGSANGTGSDARFSQPHGVAVDSVGKIYVADTENQTIRKVTPAGVVTTLAGLAGNQGSADGTGSAARFNYPFALAVNSAGDVYVSDLGDLDSSPAPGTTIRKVTPGGVVTTLAGSGSDGSVDGTRSAARFNHPYGVAVDGAGNVYVADSNNNAIRKVTPAGVVTTLAGNPTNPPFTGSGSSGLAVGSADNVYVADPFTIRKVTPAGVVTTLAGLAGNEGSADGTGSAARFSFASGVAVDGAGNVYVADTGNFTIRKVTPAGVETTLAGQAGNQGSMDGPGYAARFRRPSGVAVDSGGNVYVADAGNNTIRKVTPAGVVTTLAGLQQDRGSTDGRAASRSFILLPGWRWIARATSMWRTQETARSAK